MNGDREAHSVEIAPVVFHQYILSLDGVVVAALGERRFFPSDPGGMIGQVIGHVLDSRIANAFVDALAAVALSGGPVRFTFEQEVEGQLRRFVADARPDPLIGPVVSIIAVPGRRRDPRPDSGQVSDNW